MIGRAEDLMEDERVLVVAFGGQRRRYLVLSMSELMAVVAAEPHRLEKVGGQWCVRLPLDVPLPFGGS